MKMKEVGGGGMLSMDWSEESISDHNILEWIFSINNIPFQ